MPLTKLQNIINEQTSLFFINNPIKPEGPNIIVQIDETKLNCNVKSHRDKPLQACWCFCIVETSFKPASEKLHCRRI